MYFLEPRERERGATRQRSPQSTVLQMENSTAGSAKTNWSKVRTTDDDTLDVLHLSFLGNLRGLCAGERKCIEAKEKCQLAKFLHYRKMARVKEPHVLLSPISNRAECCFICPAQRRPVLAKRTCTVSDELSRKWCFSRYALCLQSPLFCISSFCGYA